MLVDKHKEEATSRREEAATNASGRGHRTGYASDVVIVVAAMVVVGVDSRG
jgi:hypothetical protein